MTNCHDRGFGKIGDRTDYLFVIKCLKAFETSSAADNDQYVNRLFPKIADSSEQILYCGLSFNPRINKCDLISKTSQVIQKIVNDRTLF